MKWLEKGIAGMVVVKSGDKGSGAQPPNLFTASDCNWIAGGPKPIP